MPATLARKEFGRTGLKVPPIIFGTSCLGNLYEALSDETKLAIMREWFKHVPVPVVLDSAGKYGAGLALETIGRGLKQLGVPAKDVIISNKLAWARAPLTTPEPTFEPGVWKGLKHDAVQRISYRGILECFEQGCELLGGYAPALVSVHDPDEYLMAAPSPAERQQRLQDVLDAYRALGELKAKHAVKGIGIGSKDWRTVQELHRSVRFDWVMFAISPTILRHPPELMEFIEKLTREGVAIVNSAVFHAGFLTGGAFFDYQKLDPKSSDDAPLFAWRDSFFTVCKKFEIKPAAACVQFALKMPGVVSVALNTGKPERIGENVRLTQTEIPAAFWQEMKLAGLLEAEYRYV
ncbi:MAG TPA: aldo/keto reductase [Planctomycetota bacterium]|jgi:D-threo-aldose 1-dehydrogenase